MMLFVITITYRHIARIINLENTAEILEGRHGFFKLLNEAQVNSSTTKVLVSEVNKLLRIYYTILVTSATPECTFSAMCKLKNCMRATMTQKKAQQCSADALSQRPSRCHVPCHRGQDIHWWQGKTQEVILFLLVVLFLGEVLVIFVQPSFSLKCSAIK